LPLSHFHVVTTIDLKHDYLTRWQVPLTVKEAPPTGTIAPFHLALRSNETVLPAKGGNIKFTERMCALRYVDQSETQIGLMTDPAYIAESVLKLCGRA
jgi:hypothetical protein